MHSLIWFRLGAILSMHLNTPTLEHRQNSSLLCVDILSY